MRIYVPLRRQEFERLVSLAHDERRRPQDQAAFLLSRALLLRDTADATSFGLTSGNQEAPDVCASS
jgi:hypothetical protein